MRGHAVIAVKTEYTDGPSSSVAAGFSLFLALPFKGFVDLRRRSQN